MNPDEIKRLFPNASKSLVEANAGNPLIQKQEERPRSQAGDPTSGRSKLERCSPTTAVGQSKAKRGDSPRLLVRVTSVRRRLIDEDNLCEKYVLDCCRYAGLIPGDSPSEVRIETRQRKAAKGEDEVTVVEIHEL